MSGMAARRCSLGMEDRRGHEEAIRRFLRRIEDRAPDEPDGQGKNRFSLLTSVTLSLFQPSQAFFVLFKGNSISAKSLKLDFSLDTHFFPNET